MHKHKALAAAVAGAFVAPRKMKLQENSMPKRENPCEKSESCGINFWKFVPWDSRAFRKQEWYTIFSTENDRSIMVWQRCATMCTAGESAIKVWRDLIWII